MKVNCEPCHLESPHNSDRSCTDKAFRGDDDSTEMDPNSQTKSHSSLWKKLARDVIDLA